ncbi:GNAT family N-acetyltransferase [Chromobacterium sp. IIBBL 290-4]|uniref:GNAT family N-acetyltransferase n=1 Tax=Chromobacterium sp. IIBBL 290-4 TaxID=2953890 RepID=UPI0020B886FE|nr:GNAT family N-acetyltransferase [Chromobacterium sp. IIBBL 290-4]UTH74344.1 GNAT family N-acetyltransferase [Chromobacterium sp. IIBBL 290-4]
MTARLQKLEREDWPACFQLFQESVHALAGGAYTREQCAAWAPMRSWSDGVEQGWRERLAGAWACKAVADDGRLAGFAWLKRGGEFDMLFVAPWCGRQGLASAMIAELEAQAAREGVIALHAWASHAARPVFERAGYRLLRANRIVRNGVEIDNWLLAKGGWREEEK